jgi:hypothetical protein
MHILENLEKKTGQKVKICLEKSSFDGTTSALSHPFLECRIAKDATATGKSLW